MIDNLVRASLDGAVMIIAIWALCRAMPRLSPAVRATLWWCAAAKVIVTALWTAPLMLPVLPAPASGGSQVSARRAVVAATETPAVTATPGTFQPSTDARTVNWTDVALTLWAAGFGISAALGIGRWRRIRTVVANATEADDSVSRTTSQMASLLSLRRSPRVQMSREIESPLVTGLLRPVILLPADRFPQMPADQQRMAICHELAHIKRGDVLLGCVPAAAERIFFFHPLVRLAAREYAFWREAACDAAVLDALGTAPQAYGRLLLNLGVSESQPALGAAGAAWSFSNLKRRIVMLQQPSTPRFATRLLAGGIIALAVAAITPLRLGAREAVLPPIVSPAMWLPSNPPAAAQPPLESALAPQPQEARRERREGEDLRFVIMSDEITNMAGNTRDVERVRSLRARGETILWFVRDGKEYVVRDPGVLKQVQELWAPVGRIGAQQGEIGAQQGKIGAEQGRIGARQGHIGAEQGTIGARQAELAAREVRLAAERDRRARSDRDRSGLEEERRELEARMMELEREMKALDERMQKEGRPMDKLGAEMAALGDEMARLGIQMDEATRRAEAGMRTLMESAIANGPAQQIK